MMSSLSPKSYNVLTMAVESGVLLGYNRAFKHTEDPTPEQIQDSIMNEVMNSILEWFHIDDE